MKFPIGLGIACLCGLPLFLLTAAFVISSRYRLQIAAAMNRTERQTEQNDEEKLPAFAHAGTQPLSPLQVRWIRPGDPAACAPAAIWDKLRARRRLAHSPIYAGAAVHFLLTCAVLLPTFLNRFDTRAVVAYLLAAPELVICLFVTGASLRTWLRTLAAYLFFALPLLGIVHGWRRLAGWLNALYLLPALQIGYLLLVLPRRIRPLSMAVLAGLIFAFSEAALLLLTGSLHRVSIVVSDALVLSRALLANIGGIVCFLWVVRSQSRLRSAIVFTAAASLAFVIGSVWPRLSPVTNIFSAIPLIALSCGLVWLVFRGLRVFQSMHLVTSDLLHGYVAWGLLSLLNFAMSGVSPNPAMLPKLLFAALPFPALVLVCQFFLWLNGRKLRTVPGKRMVLLRAFDDANHVSRILELLRDSWRLFGSVELIAGADLAGWIVSPAMAEAYLLGRVPDRFLKSNAEVDRAVVALDRRIQADGRYPVNEFRCFSSAWRYAVQKLVPGADVVLMDLRAFSTRHAGCAFELSLLLDLFPLERLLLLTDWHTEAEALETLLHDVWRQISEASPNRALESPTLNLVTIRRFDESTRTFLVGELLQKSGV